MMFLVTINMKEVLNAIIWRLCTATIHMTLLPITLQTLLSLKSHSQSEDMDVRDSQGHLSYGMQQRIQVDEFVTHHIKMNVC